MSSKRRFPVFRERIISTQRHVRDCSSSTIFYRELDVVSPMSEDEEHELLLDQEKNRFIILESMLTIPQGRKVFFEPFMRLLEGHESPVRIVDHSYWNIKDGLLSEDRRPELEEILKKISGRYLNREMVRRLHLLWHSVEKMAQELFTEIQHCRQLVCRRSSAMDMMDNEPIPVDKMAAEYDSLDLNDGERNYRAWLMQPILSSIKNELDLVEVSTGTSIYRFFTAERDFKRAFDRNLSIIERFVEANLGLVVAKVRKYHPCDIMEEMDLVQEGCQGLMEAVRRFDYQRGNKLSTYAVWWIRQHIIKALMRHSRLVRLPAAVHEEGSSIRKAIDEFSLQEGRSPTPDELADFMGRDRNEIEQIYLSTAPPLSLDHTDSNHDATIADFLESRFQPPDARIVDIDTRERIDRALTSLSDREKTIITLRFGLMDGECCTLQQIGRIFGISRERVRQLESRALEKLRNHGLMSALAGNEE